MDDDISLLLADAYQRIYEHYRQTGERWELIISTGIYLTPWVVTLRTRKKWISRSGLLTEALKEVLDQWQAARE